jgi:hypothetical protein
MLSNALPTCSAADERAGVDPQRTRRAFATNVSGKCSHATGAQRHCRRAHRARVNAAVPLLCPVCSLRESAGRARVRTRDCVHSDERAPIEARGAAAYRRGPSHARTRASADRVANHSVPLPFALSSSPPSVFLPTPSQAMRRTGDDCEAALITHAEAALRGEGTAEWLAMVCGRPVC